MRVIFISSTISDLKKERLALKDYLEKPIHPQDLKVLLSEALDFPIEPNDTFKSTYEVCINKVSKSDFFILLLKKNYGTKTLPSANRLVSITHLEYLEAMKKHIPVFVFAHLSIWYKYESLKNERITALNEQEKSLLEFLKEIESSSQKKWIHQFDKINQLKQIVNSTLLSYDGSDSIADLTYPDGDKVTINKHFKKIWRIKNTGMQIWEKRFLKEENPGSGLIPDTDTVPMPTTFPGQEIDISVWFTAPKYPATCISYWKMVDESGRLYYPWKKGIWCHVNVVY